MKKLSYAEITDSMMGEAVGWMRDAASRCSDSAMRFRYTGMAQSVFLAWRNLFPWSSIPRADYVAFHNLVYSHSPSDSSLDSFCIPVVESLDLFEVAA